MERQKELDLTGKVAIITGASRGIGRQAAIDLARRGAKVALTARTVENDPDLPGGLVQTAQQIEENGGEVLIIQADVTNHADLHRIVNETVARFGGVDILVNSAAATVGPIWSKEFLDISFEEWSHQFDVHVHAPFILMQLVTPIMAARGGGRIINITTGSHEAHRLVEEKVPQPGAFGLNATVPSYYASKRALDRLGNVVSAELRAFNVYVIGLHPGFVASEQVTTRLTSQGAFEAMKDKMVDTGVPARMIVYFAACEHPEEYTGRLFAAEREMKALGLDRAELGVPQLAHA